MAVRRKDGVTEFNPGPQYILTGGDALIVMGHEEQINKLRFLTAGDESGTRGQVPCPRFIYS